MSFLYLTDRNTRLYMDSGRVIAEGKDGLQTIIPTELLEGIVIMNANGVTVACAEQLLELGIPVTYLSSSGRFFGRLESTSHVNINRLRCQFKLTGDEAFCLVISKSVVAAKVSNQITILRRYNRTRDIKEVSQIIHGMSILQNCIERAETSEQLMGYEGAAAKLYFEALSALVCSEFSFNGRSKMPPKDPFNSALSFGYTLLLYEIFTAISCRGMNPYAGFLHADRQNHPALASDLMEEWRPIIVDSLTLNLFNSAAFKKSDFKKDEVTGGILFEKEALKLFIREFEKRLRTEIGYLPHIEARMSFRRAIQCQTAALAKAFEQNDPTLYIPIRIR